MTVPPNAPAESDSASLDGDRDTGDAVNVAVVGGGPAGCSAALFAARFGLDTAVFDRGRSSIRECAHLENYLGFPAGVDPETLYGLIHAHVAEAGGTVVSERVESVERDDGSDSDAASAGGFAVETDAGRHVVARRVVAATRYGGEYLRPLDEGAMFETQTYEGEERERFDRSYAESDGATPVDGLYVASPSHETDRQAIVAAGRGARVGLRVVEDVRRERGLPEPLVDRYDWVRRAATLDAEWQDRDRWREWFDGRLPDDHALDAERWEELREAEIDRRTETYLADDDRERRAKRGQRRLLDHVDDELILERARELASESTDVTEQ